MNDQRQNNRNHESCLTVIKLKVHSAPTDSLTGFVVRYGEGNGVKPMRDG